jgi:hypothetical protein
MEKECKSIWNPELGSTYQQEKQTLGHRVPVTLSNRQHED